MGGFGFGRPFCPAASETVQPFVTARDQTTRYCGQNFDPLRRGATGLGNFWSMRWGAGRNDVGQMQAPGDSLRRAGLSGHATVNQAFGDAGPRVCDGATARRNGGACITCQTGVQIDRDLTQ